MKRLRENVLVTPDYYKKRDTLQERTLLVEGISYKALAVYRFKFTRPGKENLNGRVYGYDLWDRIIRLMAGRSTLALMNHPPEDDPGNPHDIWAVWRNLAYSNDREFVEADCYILNNENGRTALSVLEAGGEIGLSSSGFGEFLADGKTINPETYEIERVADWVLDPSYEVFGRLDDKISESSKPVSKNINEGSKMELSERKLKKLLEINLQKICETISVIGDPFERCSKAQELLEMYNDDELGSLKESLSKIVEDSSEAIRSGVESGKKVIELSESLESANISLSENQKNLESLIKENAELTKKLDEALATLDSAAAFSKDTEKVLNEALASKTGTVSFEDYETLREYTKKVVSAYAEQKSILKKYNEDRQKLAKRLRDINESQKQNRARAETARKVQERQERNEAEKKSLREKRIAYEAEQEKLRRANPEVLQYFRDSVNLYPELIEHKDRILSKRTAFEAQMAVMSILHPVGERIDEIAAISDFSLPISERTKRTPEPEIRLRKGEL
jgi:hypothetical protein